MVRLIRSISEQTQMLALNATIEAARAGESGAGFAVVANEVKLLANKTRDATADIARQVEEILSATGESAGAAAEISERMSAIGAGTEGVRREIEEQLLTIGILTDAIAETFISTEHVSENVALINNLASQVADWFAEVEDDSASLDELLGKHADDVRDYRSSFEQLTNTQFGGAA